MHAMPMQLHTEHGTMLSGLPGAAALPKGIQQAPKKQSQKEEAPKRALHQAMAMAMQGCSSTGTTLHTQTQLRMHHLYLCIKD